MSKHSKTRKKQAPAPKPQSAEQNSWLADQWEYLRELAAAIFFYAVFRLMRFLGMDELFVKAVEVLSEVATVLILAAYLYSMVRRALAKAVKRNNKGKDSQDG